MIYTKQGKTDEALKLYQESLEIKESIGDAYGKAMTLGNIAQILAFEKGDFETALSLLGESIAILEKLGSPDAEQAKQTWSQVRMAQITSRLGPEKAEELNKAIESGDQEKIKSLIAETDSQQE
jgi:tetratricopeptide (TPR) repeat protein